MRMLFIHQNFPGQYLRLAKMLVDRKDCEVYALGDAKNIRNRQQIEGVKLAGYPSPAAAGDNTHHYIKPLEAAIRRGQAVVKACLELKKRGVIPDVIYAHPGWGEALFVKDIFPNARLTLYCEFFYHARGHDVGFDPEFPMCIDDVFRVRTKNATILLSLAAGDDGISPTKWQRDAYPKEYRDHIKVAHEGVDTDLVRPNANATLAIKEGLTLTSNDEVITYVARNLEPYRGFHIFMRSLAQIQKRRPHAHTVIVGAEGVSYGVPLANGQTYKQKMLEEVGAGLDLSRVHFLGQIPYDTLLQVYQVSSVHIYLTYPFVLSWSLLEAMSAGCTVVASRTPPVEEVITDGKNGYLVDFFDTAALTARVEEVLQDRKRPAAVRDRARRTVISAFDLNSVCLPRHLELLGLEGTRKEPWQSNRAS